MKVLPFDVNDATLRREFVNEQLVTAIDALEAESTPAWGEMSAQHMVEHLTWVFEASIGKAEVRCAIPDGLRAGARVFLFNNMPTPKRFKNPVLPRDQPPTLKQASLDAARVAFKQAVTAYRAYYRENPDAVHTHPLFGELGAEDWERTHYKHGYHHLLQFGLIAQTPEIQP